MKVFIPENLELETYKHSDKYYYIISVLTYRLIFDKTLKASSFIPVMSKILHDIINSRYKKRVMELVEMNVLAIRNNYWAGNISKRYRLKKPYRNTKLKQVLIKDEKITQRIRKHRAKRLSEIVHPQHEYIYNNLIKTEINNDDALKLLDELNLSDVQNNHYKIMLDRLNEKDIFWTVGETGRIYNNVTCLPRVLRSFLKYQNKPLVEIDVRTSQPFILNLLIKEYLALKSSTYSSNYDNITSTNDISIPIYVTTFPDVELYKELTTNGTFYDFLIENFHKGFEKSDYLLDDLSYCSDRDEFKEKLFGRVFYCYESDLWITNESVQFKEMFPNVTQIISYHKKDEYGNLARKLQSIESEIMIKNVVRRLMNEKIFALTIHDSILALEEDSIRIKQIMEEEFQKVIGLIPQIRIKN